MSSLAWISSRVRAFAGGPAEIVIPVGKKPSQLLAPPLPPHLPVFEDFLCGCGLFSAAPPPAAGFTPSAFIRSSEGLGSGCLLLGGKSPPPPPPPPPPLLRVTLSSSSSKSKSLQMLTPVLKSKPSRMNSLSSSLWEGPPAVANDNGRGAASVAVWLSPSTLFAWWWWWWRARERS